MELYPKVRCHRRKVKVEDTDFVSRLDQRVTVTERTTPTAVVKVQQIFILLFYYPICF